MNTSKHRSTAIRLGGYRYSLDCLKVCGSYAKASICHTRVLHQSTRGRTHRTGDHTSCIYPRITCARVTSREVWVGNLKDDTSCKYCYKRRYVCIISFCELRHQVVNFNIIDLRLFHHGMATKGKSASSKYAPVATRAIDSGLRNAGNDFMGLLRGGLLEWRTVYLEHRSIKHNNSDKKTCKILSDSLRSLI